MPWIINSFSDNHWQWQQGGLNKCGSQDATSKYLSISGKECLNAQVVLIRGGSAAHHQPQVKEWLEGGESVQTLSLKLEM